MNLIISKETSHSVRRIFEVLDRFKFHLLIFLFSFLLLSKFSVDPDLGWHLAMGRHFLQTGEILRGDIFSWTMPGYVWGNSYFLYQIFASFLFLKFGYIATSLVFAFLSTLGMILVLPRKITAFTILVLSLGIGVYYANLGVRPHAISFFLFCLLLVLLKRGIFKKKLHFVFWFLFFVLWANLHRGFVVGFLVLTSYLFVDYVFVRSFGKKVLLWPRINTVVASFLGTFLTPFPLSLWHSGVFLDLTSKDNLLSINEWQSITLFFPINLIFAASGIIFVFILLKKFKTIDPAWYIPATFLFAFTFLAITFAFFWGAMFIFLVSRVFEPKLKLDFFSKTTFSFCLFAVGLSIMLSFFLSFVQSQNFEKRLELDGYPLKAVSFMKESGLGEGLFNDYAWGGFLTYWDPSIKVFVDGRMASWRGQGENVFANYVRIGTNQCEVREDYDIRVVLAKKGAGYLKCFEEFETVYSDAVSEVLTR